MNTVILAAQYRNHVPCMQGSVWNQNTLTDASSVEMEWKHMAYNNTAPVDLTLCYTSTH